MNLQVLAYSLLFLAIFLTGFFAGHINGDAVKEVGEFIWETIKKNKFSFFSRKYWYNRKLKKDGVIKQVLCLFDSFSTDPNATLVKAGQVYNVIHEKDFSEINWGDIRGTYLVREHGWNVEHSKSIFMDYYGEDVEKLMEKHINRRLILNDWLQTGLAYHEAKMKEERLKNFKLLR